MRNAIRLLWGTIARRGLKLRLFMLLLWVWRGHFSEGMVC